MHDASEVAANARAALERLARGAYDREQSRIQAARESLESEAKADEKRTNSTRAAGTPRESADIPMSPRAGYGRGLAFGQYGAKKRSTLAKRKAPRLLQSRLDLDSHTPADTVKASELWGPGHCPPIVAVYVRGRFKARYEFRTGTYLKIK